MTQSGRWGLSLDLPIGLGHRPRVGSVVSSPHCMNDPQPEGHMASHIERRKFLATLGGAAVAWPVAVRAQQTERMRRIVFLHSLAKDDPFIKARIAAFQQRLEALGWTQHDIRIEHLFSAGDLARMQAYAAEVVNSAPDLIVANSTPVLAALKQATHSIPIVFAVL